MFDPDFNPYERIEQLEAHILTLFVIVERLSENNNTNSQNILALTDFVNKLVSTVESQEYTIRHLKRKIHELEAVYELI